MTRVIHTGDTHVGYRQYHSPERRADFLSAFEQVLDDAVAADVDAVVHAGDLFHDRRPDLVDIQGVIDALRDLAAADVPFLAVVGNHETKRDTQWLDLFEELGLATRLGREPVVVGDTALYGLDFVPRARRDELRYDFARPPDGVRRTALVAHGLFEPFAHADWDTSRLLAESTVDFDALLLGDDHRPGREYVDGTLLTYCGSTERTAADERADRGYNLVTFHDSAGTDAAGDARPDRDGDSDRDGADGDTATAGSDADPDGPVSVERRPIDARPFVFLDLELSAGEGERRVREALRDRELSEAVAVVTVTGGGDPLSPAAIEELAVERGALVARVNDRRELETEDPDREVTFADPDRAVRERVAEMGLPAAAREIDRTVRDLEIADSNVRSEVEKAVRDRLEDDDLAALADVADDRGADDVTGTDAEETTAGTDAADDEAADGDSGSGRDGAAGGTDAADDGATDDQDQGQASVEEYL